MTTPTFARVMSCETRGRTNALKTPTPNILEPSMANSLSPKLAIPARSSGKLVTDSRELNNRAHPGSGFHIGKSLIDLRERNAL